jgi:hypothetical protein
MKSSPVIFFSTVALLILSACSSSGYNRSYIISEGVDEEIISEPIDKL